MKTIRSAAAFATITLVASAAQAIVTPPPPPSVYEGRRTTGACFWQVPGSVQLVNLYALQTVYTVLDGDHYVTRFRFGYGSSIEIPIPKGAPLTLYTDQVKARVDACSL